MAFSDTRFWSAYWISFGSVMVDWTAKDFLAPYFRKEFELTHPKNCQLLGMIGGLTVIRELMLPEKRFAVFCLAVSSLLNGTGQGITMWNLKKGGRA